MAYPVSFLDDNAHNKLGIPKETIISIDADWYWMERPREGAFAEVPDDMDAPDYAMSVCKALGKIYGRLTVASDLHPSSQMVLSAAKSGLTASGAEVRDAGSMPSPALPFASRSTKCTIMVGSPDRVELISYIDVRNPDGTFLDAAALEKIRVMLEEGVQLPGYKDVGNVRPVTGGMDRYRAKVVSNVESADCLVIMDCASDCPAFVAPHIMSDLGAEVVTVNSYPGGKAPSREPRPDELNLRNLSRTVKANPGSLGLAFNSDGSRLAAYAEDGRYMNGIDIFAVLIDVFRPTKVAVPNDAPMIVEYLMGVDNVIRTRIGSAGVGAAVRDKGLTMGSDCAGSFVFADVSYALDGIAAGAYLAKVAGETSIKQLLDSYPQTVRAEDSMKFQWNDQAAVKALTEELRSMEHREFSDVDGIRVGMESGWFLVSRKGKEAHIKAEAKDKMYLAGMMDLAKNAIESGNRLSK